jgi:hypothetical protein
LQNSTDAQIVAQLEQDLKKKQDLLNDTVNLLGSEDIKSLSDIENLLQGKTLRELITQHEQELAKNQQTLTNTQEEYLAKIQSLNQEIDLLEKAKIETNQAY